MAKRKASASAGGTATTPGSIIGTVQYMSPEQLLGQETDARTDLFSLGVVLYEMAAGQPPFRGSSPAETIARILRDEPDDIRSLNPAVPIAFRKVITRCLEKDRDRRYQSARELLRDLRALQQQAPTTPVVVANTAPARGYSIRRLVVLLAAGLLATALILVRMTLRPTGLSPEEIRSLAALPAHLRPSGSVDPAAHESYLRGRFHWNKRTKQDLEKAIQHFQHAIRIAPDFALAHAALADSYNLLTPYAEVPPHETYPQARLAALKALSLDETLGEAHASLAVVKHEYDWDHAGAEDHFKRSIELRPDFAPTRQWYAEYLTRMRRCEEALAEIEIARKLDPLSLIVNSIAGWVLQFAGRHDAAIEQLKATIDLDPRFVPAHGYLGKAFLTKRMFDEAIEQYKKALRLSADNPRYLADLAVAYALAGREAEARKIAGDLERLSRSSFVPSFHAASVHLALGEKESALAGLRKARTERGVWILFINFDPLFDSLRSDPRFEDLLRAIGVS
jgi:tetratricopeptide (TPR) repeat protein